MIGRTAGLYLAHRFAKTILGIFLFVFLIVYLFDFLELFRRSADKADIPVRALLWLSLMRVPNICEQILPFATLFGTMAAFLAMSRNLELVVLRAAGVSVWQFLVPPVAVALALGILATLVYNPVAAYMKDLGAEAEQALFLRNRVQAKVADATWFRQDGPQGETVVRAQGSADRGLSLAGVTILQFGRDGSFSAAIDADQARYADHAWTLQKGTIARPDGSLERFSTYVLPTFLTIEQARDQLASPDTVPIWQLPRLIESAQKAGIPAFRYDLQLHILLARPLLMVAMVLLAGLFSLTVFRFGNVGGMILGGVIAGFVLYVINVVAQDVGGAGLVAPPLAAWAPGVVASLMGFTILLYREDG